ncbi:hypothetical protein M409DRAFT_17477 [Zasmidium cellare ATCC 36951]|uniref:C2H2-type domain-containing protein n=1 Tax=Zasmidium cellare ATCC 36951 TaxID=1080233 RepID=A0A6A6D1C4_ZASCE|nr:uncharacterized protein M409DRAFT_17477 [Zasmidium cellare ATCC 36951]KAF2172240.1 hypothetical protein M409DRAFT_17477 [Zasmidium cellare ATCC 36951]
MTSPAPYECIDEDAPSHNESLEPNYFKPMPSPEPEPDFPPTKSKTDPSVEVLGYPPISETSSRSSSGPAATLSPEQRDHRGDMPEAGAPALAEGSPHDGLTKASSPDDLRQTAAMAIRVGATKTPPTDAKELAERPVHRVDSAQDSSESVPQLPPEKRPQRSGRASPLKLETASAVTNVAPAWAEDSIAKSPTLSKHMIQVEEKVPSSYPAAQATSPTVETSANSLRKASLPPFRQLADLAEIASQQTQQDNRPPAQHAHHHSQSFSSTTSQSPMNPYHPSYTNSTQTSPVSYHGFARSPTSTEGFSYGSPSQNPGSAYYYPDRRTSVANDSAQTYPTPVPSLPSNPSSGESQVGNAGSSTDGYSTSHTTPIDPGTVPPDTMGRPILPPVPGMPPGMAIIPAGGFMCDYPGCTALPFQTQYLLSSHRNVHSQSRPHYCPVEGCPRSEGGRGFKRKNEMIRHGLVHNSPGYICPFCPDREHRYPRPDNLQRHVRVHHVDKDRDDPALREVLAQRSEGTTQKQRRRRTQGTTSREGQAPESAP